jgi:hypothetical protein
MDAAVGEEKRMVEFVIGPEVGDLNEDGGQALRYVSGSWTVTLRPELFEMYQTRRLSLLEPRACVKMTSIV